MLSIFTLEHVLRAYLGDQQRLIDGPGPILMFRTEFRERGWDSEE